MVGKIYFNIENEGINYLEEDFVSKFDIPLSEMANKIILVSMNCKTCEVFYDIYESNLFSSLPYLMYIYIFKIGLVYSI